MLVVCLVGGLTLPGPVLVGAEIAVLVLLVAEGVAYARLRRRGLSRREVLAELVPEPVRRLAGHELRLMGAWACGPPAAGTGWAPAGGRSRTPATRPP
ncbi:hypothetical protein ACWDX6_01485 [Streptomyces sp. NPDC003027]